MEIGGRLHQLDRRHQRLREHRPADPQAGRHRLRQRGDMDDMVGRLALRQRQDRRRRRPVEPEGAVGIVLEDCDPAANRGVEQRFSAGLRGDLGPPGWRRSAPDRRASGGGPRPRSARPPPRSPRAGALGVALDADKVGAGDPEGLQRRDEGRPLDDHSVAGGHEAARDDVDRLLRAARGEDAVRAGLDALSPPKALPAARATPGSPSVMLYCSAARVLARIAPSAASANPSAFEQLVGRQSPGERDQVRPLERHLDQLAQHGGAASTTDGTRTVFGDASHGVLSESGAPRRPRAGAAPRTHRPRAAAPVAYGSLAPMARC